MKSIEMQAFPRVGLGRNAVKKIRSAGRVPATIYGRHIQPQHRRRARRAGDDLAG